FTHPVRVDGPGREAFAKLPRAYVMCLQDMAIRPPVQRLMIEAAGCDPVIEIDTDHAVWASRPDELAAALNRLTGLRPSPTRCTGRRSWLGAWVLGVRWRTCASAGWWSVGSG